MSDFAVNAVGVVAAHAAEALKQTKIETKEQDSVWEAGAVAATKACEGHSKAEDVEDSTTQPNRSVSGLIKSAGEAMKGAGDAVTPANPVGGTAAKVIGIVVDGVGTIVDAAGNIVGDVVGAVGDGISAIGKVIKQGL